MTEAIKNGKIGKFDGYRMDVDRHVFLRSNIGAAKDEPATRLTETEALQLLAVVFKDPQRAINRLKRGDKLETRYATYVARKA